MEKEEYYANVAPEAMHLYSLEEALSERSEEEKIEDLFQLEQMLDRYIRTGDGAELRRDYLNYKQALQLEQRERRDNAD